MLDQPINNSALNADYADSLIMPMPHLDQDNNILKGTRVINPGDPEYDACVMEINSSIKNSFKRFPALLLTLGLELIVAFVIQGFITTLTSNDLLISFLPIISAISGNVGLQSCSINTRALALNIIDAKKMRYPLKKALYVGFYLGLYSGISIGVIGGVWGGIKG